MVSAVPERVDTSEAEENSPIALFDAQAAERDLSTYDRQRWSNLDNNLVHRPGNLLGSVSLVAGTTIGAGILALPAVTKDAGFIPSCSTLVAFYVFSAVSGLLITEVNINTVCELGSGSSSLQAMVRRTLGKPGARVASAAYLFLHYALLVAYIARAGGSIANTLAIPSWVGAAAFAGGFGGMCFFSSTRVLDTINSGLLALVILSFLALVGLAAPEVDPGNLLPGDWSAVPDTLPVVALAFVYQNIVPVIVTNLEGDVTKVRTAILAGLAIPLIMFTGWEAAMLGSVSPGAATFDPVLALRDQSEAAGPLIEAFSFLAIATSFIGFVLGLAEFLEEVLGQGRGRAPAYALTLLPPYAMSLAFPDIFFQALDLAGTYGVLVLFGVLPPAMAWSERYRKTTLTSIRALPGGRPVLLAVASIAGGIICNELVLAIHPTVAM